MKVNAQIALVLWLLESFINVLTMVIWGVGSFGPATLLVNMIQFLIILPYSYLTNTSHNKSRIVEEGWQNVLKNIFMCKNNNSENNHVRVYVISSDPSINSDEINDDDPADVT